MSQATAIETVSPRRGRKPVTTHTQDTLQQIEEAQAELAPMVSAIREQSVSMPRAEMAASLRLAEMTGTIAAFRLNAEVNRVAMLKAFAEIRDAKTYKGCTVRHVTTGELVTVNTWDEFCEAHGYSKNKINEELQNLATFGGNVLEQQQALGLGYRDLRLLRRGVAALPPEERKAILDEVKNAEGPEELKDKLQDLRAELAEAKVREKELTETAQAREKVYQQKTEKLEELETRLERLNSISPDDKARTLAELNAKTEVDVDLACQKVFVEVMALCALAAKIMRDERATEATAAYVHQRASLLVDRIAEAMLGAGIDVDLRLRFELPSDETPATEGTTQE